MSTESEFTESALVLYKSHPARVASTGSKITIILEDGKTVSVRDKDITLLHGGPFKNFSELKDEPGDLETACEMLAGETASLHDLAELIYNAITPSTVWAVCRLLQDGLYLSGTIEAIRVRPLDERESEIQSRAAKIAQKDAWQSFLGRVKKGAVIDEDYPRLKDLTDFALGKTPSSRIMKDLGMNESVEHAHTLLLKLGVWTEMVNPYPVRMGLSLEQSYPSLAPLPDDTRRDLTHLAAFAIDDEGNTDPDDAVSIDGSKLWVHIADVAALVTPDSPADLHARAQAANLYLPEKTVHMLPPEATDLLGLGLHETSPALSFGITLKDDGAIDTVEIVPSVVKVTRLTYTSAQTMLSSSPLKEIYAATQLFRKYRLAQNAISLSFPEVKIRIVDGRVVIKEIPNLDTQDLVTDAMLMAGEAAAKYATANAIPFPYTTQPPPETIESPSDPAGMFAYRKQLKPSAVKSSPDIHAGLGLLCYSRATSPLRRYLDLIAHQQLRASVNKHVLMDENEIMNRIGAAGAMTGVISKCERLSNQHWTLVHLMQNPNWTGTGTIVDIRERFSIVQIPSLAYETRIQSTAYSLNEELTLTVGEIDLPGLTARFIVI